ncbi:UPF0711 protein C18orf21 homolog [Glandiceps talaboti]
MKVTPQGTFFSNVAKFYSGKLPEIAAYYTTLQRYNQRNEHTVITGDTDATCPRCGFQLNPNLHKFRIKPKRKKSSRIRKLEKKMDKGHFLPRNQKKHLQNFRQRTNQLIMSCQVCRKVVKYTGGSLTYDQNHSSQKTTPWKSFSKINTSKTSVVSSPGSPYLTSTPSVSSAKKESKKWKHSKLQRMLKTSQENSPNASLQDFLLSV